MKLSNVDSMTGRSPLGRWGIVALIITFMVLAFLYSVINPLHEATDELRHYRFIRTIATTGSLPVQGQEPCRSQSHHPPLYYALGALATFWIDTGRDLCQVPPENPFWAYRYWEVGRDNKNQYLHGPEEDFPWTGEALAVHLGRSINILLGAAVVWLTWASGRVVWPQKQEIALGAAALVAFNPMFLYMSGAVNNDIIAALSGSAILFACLYLLHAPDGLTLRWGFIFGALYGIALMSKVNLAAGILLIEAAITWVAWRSWQFRRWLGINAILVIIAAAMAGWWFLRNQSLYGDLTGFSAVTELWGARNPMESFSLALSELPYAWTTLWGRFGFGQIPLPQPFYSGLLILTVVGLLGALLSLVRSKTETLRISLLFLVADAILFFLVLFGYMLVSPAGPNGRFFFPALSALALLIFSGLAYWSAALSRGARLAWSRIRQKPPAAESGAFSLRLVTIVTTVGMLLLALLALFGYLAPAYAKPETISEDEAIPNSVNAHFDSLATLLGYELSSDVLRPGEPLDLDLYWQVDSKPPGDYLLFVHLINEEGAIIAQRDTHPGLGNYPTGQWREGERFVDSIRLYLPETAYSPAEASLSIGLYDPLAYRLAVSSADGSPLGDALTLSDISIQSKPGDFPNPQDQNFSNEIRLVGYEYGSLEAGPGDTLDIDLYWEALHQLDGDYIVQVRLLDQENAPLADADGRPIQGTSRTEGWQPGQIVTDTHQLTIPSETPAGTYQVEIALLDADSGVRQNIVANDGHWIDNRLILAPIRIHS